MKYNIKIGANVLENANKPPRRPYKSGDTLTLVKQELVQIRSKAYLLVTCYNERTGEFCQLGAHHFVGSAPIPEQYKRLEPLIEQNAKFQVWFTPVENEERLITTWTRI